MERFLFTARQHIMPNFIPLFLLTYISTMPVQLKRSFHSSTYGTTLDGSSWLRDKENVFFSEISSYKDVFFLSRSCLCACVFASGYDSCALVHVNCICACFYDKKSPQSYAVTVCLLFVCPCLSTGSRVCGEIFPSRHHEKCSRREFTVISASP